MPTKTEIYRLPDLPYDFGALEPHISWRIMALHHGKHHATYVKGANTALDKLQSMRSKDDFSTITMLEKNLAFNVSGHVLHSVFWTNLSPDGGGEPTGELSKTLGATFGKFATFKKQMTEAAATIQGSGWALASWEPVAGRVVVQQVHDHQGDHGQGTIPLLAIDAWEHAYYLQYENEKAKFFDAIWNVVNWDDVARRFAAARQSRPLAASASAISNSGGVDDALAAAWAEFSRRLGALGEALLGEDFPVSPDDRAEGFRHLAEHAVLWLGWSIGYPDPGTPAFHRQNDLITRWGGPNVDNVYRHARIDPSHRYRITGRMHSCEDFILAMRAGFMHMERWGTVAQVSASDLGIAEGQDFEILLGGDGRGAVPLPEAAAMASIREYYFDWRPLEPATMTIECLDATAPPARPSPTEVAARVEEAIVAVETSVRYWNRYMADARAAQQDNAWGEGFQQTKGLDAARYMFCFFDLAPDEALYVESDVPDAPYWSFQLYRLGWFDPFDFTHRITSLNHTQAQVDGDGRVRLVLAPADPGVANWLDSEGRQNGLLMYRWFWPRGDAPRPTARAVKLDDVRDTAVDPATRAAQIAARRAHVAWRFRT